MLILLAGVETLFAYTILVMIYSLLTQSEENDEDEDEDEELIDAGVKWGKFEGREDEILRFVKDAKSTIFSESSLGDVVDVSTFIPIGSANAIASFNGRYVISGRRSRTPTFEVFTVKDVKRSQDDPYPLESSLFIARVHGEDILATFGAWLYWSRHPDSLPVRASSRHYTKVPILPYPSDTEDENKSDTPILIDQPPKKTRSLSHLSHVSTKTLRSGKVY